MTKLLSDIIFNVGRLKGYNILAYQIMPDYIHLLVYVDRTLERVLSKDIQQFVPSNKSTFSNVRPANQYTISNLIQSIKGNFSRKLHMGNIWQRRFYTRIIDTGKYLRAVTSYIKYNPIKQDLPRKYHELPYQYFNNKEIENLF
ncbi:MAG: transposase [Candidatus Kerfeldbacteria bacterium]|jgi:REP element-mobilizing transposase RayT